MAVSPLRVIRILPILPILAACAAAAPAQQQVEVVDELFPGALERPHETWIVSRVVDDLTGAPIAGAEVLLVREREAPIAGEFWFTRKVTTDGDGWLRAPVHDIQGRWHIQVLRHPDYGVSTRGSDASAIWRVGRAFDLPVRITDWRGRPAPGARVGFCGGCGHTPDLVHAVADARGIAVLRGVDPWNHIRDLYVQHPGLSLGYDSVDWYPGDGPRELRCGFSEPLTGKVVDARGRPVAGVFVGGGDVHRGPWAKTAVDGTFTVLGAVGRGMVCQARLANGREVYFPDYPRHPVTLRLPVRADGDPAEGEPLEGSAESATDEPRTPVAVRTIAVRCVAAPAGLRLATEFPGHQREHDLAARDRITVPASGPFVVHMSAEVGGIACRRDLVFAGVDEQALPLELRWTPAARVRGHAVDDRGRPVAVCVRWRQRWCGQPGDDPGVGVPSPDGRFDLAALEEGRQLLAITASEREDLLPRLMWMSVPAPGEDDFDLGDVVLSSEPQLRVLDADGRPREGLAAGMVRAGWQRVGSPRWFPLRADGAWLGPDLSAGDVVVVRAGDAAVPFRVQLEGSGPWQVRVPDGQLLLDVVDEAGGRLPATVVIGDVDLDVRDRTPIEGLPHGPLRCFVSSPGRKSAIVHIAIDGAPRSVRVVLPRR
ncbi:MAG TPA: hypothetical protein ENI87_08560 [bacterium]|nr:hypothetical protein [bacterium]